MPKKGYAKPNVFVRPGVFVLTGQPRPHRSLRHIASARPPLWRNASNASFDPNAKGADQCDCGINQNERRAIKAKAHILSGDQYKDERCADNNGG